MLQLILSPSSHPHSSSIYTLSLHDALPIYEFHERSIHADLGLALVRDTQQALRADLRVLIMSATLESERLAAALDNCPLITARGRSFPVEVVYRPPRPPRTPVAHTAGVIRSEEHTSV